MCWLFVDDNKNYRAYQDITRNGVTTRWYLVKGSLGGPAFVVSQREKATVFTSRKKLERAAALLWHTKSIFPEEKWKIEEV